MLGKEIQIVAFNNPFPPNFGGAIDMFYKLKALKELGIDIYLHVFYDDRIDISGLKPLCKSIYIYKKQKNLIKHFSLIPYSSNTRISKLLEKRLSSLNAPILFESLRTVAILRKKVFKQKVAIRCHNIEHEYSWGLSKSSSSYIMKVANFIEGYKQKYFEPIVHKADVLFAISNYDYNYFLKTYKKKTIYLPVFQGCIDVAGKNGFGKYALYHGDLSIADNVKSAIFLINVFESLNIPLKCASSTKVKSLINEIDKHENISFHYIEESGDLDKLIEGAHINVLYSFQRSGTKLKVFNALFKGRHCIVNENIVDDLEVLQLCEVAENKIEYQKAVEKLIKKEFVVSAKLEKVLDKYNSKKNAEKIIKYLF